MSTIVASTHCALKEPLSKFDATGQASIINYNLPQAISYDAYSYLDLELSADAFQPNLPYDTFWERTANLTLQEIVQLLLDEIDYAGTTSLFENSHLLYRLGVISKGKKRLLDTLLVDHNAQQQSTSTQTSDEHFPVSKEVVKSYDFEIYNTTSRNEIDTDIIASSDLVLRLGDLNTQTINDIPSVSVLRLYQIAGIPLFEIAVKIKRGFKPVLTENSFGLISLEFTPQPETQTPTLELVLHFKMTNHLGDYGAGKVVKTMSLLPGETSSISIRNWQRNEVTKKRAENVLDSFSESSMDDLQKTIENENLISNTTTRSSKTSKKKRKRGGLNLGVVKFGGKKSSSSTKSFSAIAKSQVRTLASSTSKQSNKSDALREININIETTETQQSETEQTIVRELKNINQSRTLNYTFRQLLQEYVSIIYLDEVSVVFTHGNDEIETKLEAMDELLSDVLTEVAAENIKNQILAYLCNIKDYQGNTVGFVEEVNELYTNHLDPSSTTLTSQYIRKRSDLEMSYLDYEVLGIIFDITHRTLRTDALIAEALLGTGEALDCYNIKLQNEAVKEARLNNDEKEQALKILELIQDPVNKAIAYKKVFGDCCEDTMAGQLNSSLISSISNVEIYNELDDDGIDEFRFRVRSKEGQILLSGNKKYATPKQANADLNEAIHQLIHDESSVVIKEAKDGRWYFNILNRVGTIVAKKTYFDTKEDCQEYVAYLKDFMSSVTYELYK
jgi:uncharacterized protein YegP (UPF0339 family)